MISILQELLNVWVVYTCFLIYLLCSNPTRLVSCHHSKENCSVLNIDVCCNVLFGRAGSGRLICRDDNNWVVKFSSLFGNSNNNYAEIMDTYQKLCLANGRGCTFVIYYSDSKVVIDLIIKSLNKYHCYTFLLLIS
jgi:hypothetical protein